MALFDVDDSHLDVLLAPKTNVFRRVPQQAMDAVVGGALRRLGDRGLYLEVGTSLDFPSYAASSLAAQCGERAVKAVHGAMFSDVEPDAWFETLSPFMEGKQIVVSVVERSRKDSELGNVLWEDWSWRHWVKDAKAIVVRCSHDPEPTPAWIVPHKSSLVGETEIWQAVEHDTHRYTMAFAHEMLIGPLPHRNVLRNTFELANRLWRALPGELSELVTLLAVNERPISKANMVNLDLVKPSVYDWALRSHLLEERAGLAVLPRCLAKLAKPDAPTKQHALWATAYRRALEARSIDPVTATIEAYRHYAAIPDPESAFELSRFGLGVALEMAVNLSRSNQYQAAAKSYEKIFELAQRYPKRRRLSGYAKHYLHYNRYKAGDERLPDTVRGYGDSLKFWPENALFHSRQVRALFHDKRENEALAAFDQAWQVVLSPEESSRYLVDRLVRRLLDRQLVVPALAILERLPPGITIDPVLERLLVQATSRGWQLARLWIPGVEPVSLREPVEGVVQLCDDGSYLARVGSFTTTSSDRFGAVIGATREALFNQLAHVWVQETSHLSSRQEKFSHHAYAQILQLGPDVIPGILRWIQRGGRGHWDRALDSLATSRPENLTGPLSAVMKQWVAWGVEQKLIGEARDVHRLG